MIPHHLHLNMIAAMLAFRLGCQSITPWLRQPNEGPCEPSAFPQGLSNLSHVSGSGLCRVLHLITLEPISVVHQAYLLSCKNSILIPHPVWPQQISAGFLSYPLFFLLFFQVSFSCLCVLCLFHVYPCVWFSLFSFSCSALTVLLWCSISFHLSNVRNFTCLLVCSPPLVAVQ